MAAQRSDHENSPAPTTSAGNRVAHAPVPQPRNRVNDASGAHEDPPSAPIDKSQQSRGKAHKSSVKITSPSRTGRSSMSDSDGEKKKKSKLGYTRITIACSHCRRRKIRCIPADRDPKGRCQNCIKLKKECVFSAVDQQAAIEHAAPSSSKTDASPTVESSSPGGAESSLDEDVSQGGFPTLSPNMTTSPTGIAAGYGGFPVPEQTQAFSQGEAPWQYSSTFQPILPLGHATQYQQYSPFVNQTSSGDFAPYPNYYASHLDPHAFTNPHRSPGLMAHPMGSTEAYQQMPMPNATVNYGHYLPTSLASQTPSTFDPLRYQAVPEAETHWYGRYSNESGLEEDYETMPDTHTHPGRRRQ